jgi:hypothetical protein
MTSRLCNPDSVHANHLGEITSEQKQLLIEAQRPFDRMVIRLLFVACLTPSALALLIARSWEGMPFLLGGGEVALGILYIAIYMVAKRWLKISMRRKLDEGMRVEPLEGKVVWEQYQYVARYAKCRLKPIYRSAPLELPPGNYNFWVLEGTRWLLSAESIGGQEDQQAELLRALAQANGFHSNALDSNREGRLTLQQGLRLLLSRLIPLTLLLAFVFVVSAFAVGLMAAWLRDTTIPFGVVLFVLFAMAGSAWLMWRFFIPYMLDVFTRQVLIAEGFGRRDKIEDGEGATYHYLVGNLRFIVSGSAYNALIEGIRYRVYYTPRTKKLVNIEPLDA